jgi:fluoride exporter
MKTLLFVGLGGGLGSVLRYLVQRSVTFEFPFSTIIINVLGSLLIGILFAWSQKIPESHTWLYLLTVTGFCGGFTTFSTFSLDTLLLIGKNDFSSAFLNILLSVGLCLGAVALGYYLFKALFL